MDEEELGALVALLAAKLGGNVSFNMEEYLEAKKAKSRVKLYRSDGWPEFRLVLEEAPLTGSIIEVKEIEA